jgi:hypothetical protein
MPETVNSAYVKALNSRRCDGNRTFRPHVDDLSQARALLPTPSSSRVSICATRSEPPPYSRRGVAVESVVDLANARGLRIWVVSGGWCDFFQGAPQSDQTDRSVARQVHIAHQPPPRNYACFSRLKFEDYSQRAPRDRVRESVAPVGPAC